MNRDLQYEVLVVGGGSAGVAAAIGSARAGKKTLLIERNAYFGGQATHSNVSSYCGFYTRGEKPDQQVLGVGEEVMAKLREMGEDTAPTVSKATGNASVRFDPEKLKLVLDELMEQSGADYLLHTSVIGVSMEEGRITAVECFDDEGRFIVTADAFVDASGDGILAHLAGAETLWGDAEGNTQMSSLSVRVDHMPQNVEIDPKVMTAAVLKGKEEGDPYLQKEKGLIIKIPAADYGFMTIPSTHITDLTGKTLTAAEMNLRKQAYSYAKYFRKYVPGLQDLRIVTSGPAIGVRESRRIVGDDTLLHEDVLACVKREDSVARGAWSPEIHQDIKTLTYIVLPDNDFFSIPLGALHSKDIANLWAAGRNISCDHITNSSIRVMGTGFATGQAAGVAAALAPAGDTAKKLPAVQAELKRQGALI